MPSALPRTAVPSSVLLVLLLWPLVGGTAWATERFASAADLTYITEEFRPLSYLEQDRVTGLATELLRLVWRDLGVAEQPIQLLPWSRGYKSALNRPGTVLFTTARSPQREELFKWACPVTDGMRSVLLANGDRSLQISGFADLAGYRIGVVSNDLAEQVLQQHLPPGTHLVQRRTYEALFLMLLRNRVDLIAVTNRAIDEFLTSSRLEPGVFRQQLLLAEAQPCFAFHRDTPNELVEQFQQALARVRAGREYRQLLLRYQP